MGVLTRTYACARQPLPSVEVLDFQARCFDEALADVPTDDLDEVYRRAIKAHTSNFPLGTGELITAWHSLQADRREAARAKAQAEREAEWRAREAAHAEHLGRLQTDPAYKAEHEAAMGRIEDMRRDLRARFQPRAVEAPDAIPQ